MSRFDVVLSLFFAASAWSQQPPPPSEPAAKPAPKKAEPNRAAKAMAALAERAEIHTNLAYVEKGHERQKLDVYVPKSGDGPFPLLIWIHGGAWQGGLKEGCPFAWYVNRGYVAASIQEAEAPPVKTFSSAARRG